MASSLDAAKPTIPYAEKSSMAGNHDPHLQEINETGHVQELERNFSLLSVCSVGIVTGNTWAALGGSIVVAIYNGGPPGVLYEFIAVSIFYWLVAASIAELASSMPSSAGVYHWASITPGPKALPMINNMGLFFILAGVFITIIVCATMPHTTGSGYASSSFVWADWSNQTGYASNGFVFLAGMLNGAYSVGTPDCVSHLAEEIPYPRRNIPLAIGAQMVIGFFTAFFYMIAIFYSISSIDDVLSAPYFPLATIYGQATSSNAGTIGLLFIIFVPILCTCIGTFITSGRCLWTLSRDRAVPFSDTFGVISPRFKNPFNATLFCGCFSTVLGAIYVGSSTAFNAFVGSFVVLSTLSYLASILPFMLTRRFSRSQEHTGLNANGMRPGPFQMGNKLGLVNTFPASRLAFVPEIGHGEAGEDAGEEKLDSIGNDEEEGEVASESDVARDADSEVLKEDGEFDEA
ncbi:hypothetical protein EG329_003193 [Mollisiaceae sp. DMI_Dod_QoI]|nr:hypothetical protein EG329_003193 [Helotiales sp. DMI_Dod_QoI]